MKISSAFAWKNIISFDDNPFLYGIYMHGIEVSKVSELRLTFLFKFPDFK